MLRMVAMLAFVPLGCSSVGPATDASADGPTDVGVDAKDGAPSDAGVCALSKPYSSKNATCNGCAQTKCCAEINACYADLECDDGYVNCILACALLPGDAGDAGVSMCLADCGAQHPKGKTEYDTAIGCADTKCATECK